VLLTFNDAGAGDEKKLGTADGDVLDGEGHGGIIRFQKIKSLTFANCGRMWGTCSALHPALHTAKERRMV
jgi:hypothetical protein